MTGMHEKIRERPEGFRFITYLSPGIPQALFEAVVDHAGRALGGNRTSLLVEARVSGPEKGAEDPFSRDEADVGFMCSPSFLWLWELKPSPVELLGAAPVFRDERASGRPVYFCEVIVRRDCPIRSFAGLRGRSWAYNDVLVERLLQPAEEAGTDGRRRAVLRPYAPLRIPPELDGTGRSRRDGRGGHRLERFEDTAP